MPTYSVLQLVYLDDTGDSYYRMRWPGDQLAKQTGWSIVNLDARSQERLALAEDVDLLVLYQSRDIDLLPILHRRRSRGLKTLVEYNDNFYAPAAWSPVVKEWSSPIVWQAYEEFMRIADGVIVTGPGLRAALTERVPDQKFTTLRNHLPTPPDPLRSQLQRKTKDVSVGWGGSFGHLADFLSALPALWRILKLYPASELHLMGNEALLDLTCITPDPGRLKSQLRFTPWGSMQQYYSFLAPVQLGVVPLLESDYNRCRSDIKAVEMAGLGVLPILPDALPYSEFINETGAPTYRSWAELASTVSNFLKSPELIAPAVSRCHDYVASRRVGPVDHERRLVYQSFLPPEPQEQRWTYCAGYHEINGTAEVAAQSKQTLLTAQEHLTLGKDDAALACIRGGLDHNEAQADLALAEIKILGTRKSDAFLEAVTRFRNRFPLDLRADLLAARVVESADFQRSVWPFIIDRLTKEARIFCDFYQRGVVEAFRPHSGVVPEFLSPLVAIFPDALRLRFEYAESLRRRGELLLAHEQFHRVAQGIALLEANGASITDLDGPYVRMWEAALDPAGMVEIRK